MPIAGFRSIQLSDLGGSNAVGKWLLVFIFHSSETSARKPNGPAKKGTCHAQPLAALDGKLREARHLTGCCSLKTNKKQIPRFARDDMMGTFQQPVKLNAVPHKLMDLSSRRRMPSGSATPILVIELARPCVSATA